MQAKFTSFALILALFIQSNYLSAQARLILGNASPAYMVMSGGTSATPIYLVLGSAATPSSNPNTITRNSTAGIISEGEFNLVKWYVGNGTGTGYLFPWRDNTVPATEDASVQFDITMAGTSTGFFLASTYDGVTNNFTYMPTGITGMGSGSTGNASQWVIDRFWSLIDEASYPTKPGLGNLTFTYIDNEHSANTGPITEANLRAQRFNPGAGLGWEGLTFGAAPNTAANTQNAGAITAASMFRWWTLVDNVKPLPVSWLRLSAECNKGLVTVKWSTASEQNSDFFTVEKSPDGINFNAIENIIAAGNSSMIKNYSAIDNDTYSGISYYRIRETDFNSSSMVSKTIIVVGCSNDDIFVYGSEGGLSVNINANDETSYTIELYDLLGQQIIGEIKSVRKGENHIKIVFDNLASSIYIAKVYNTNTSVTKKVFIRSTYGH